MRSSRVAVAALPRLSVLVLHWHVIEVTCDMVARLIWSTAASHLNKVRQDRMGALKGVTTATPFHPRWIGQGAPGELSVDNGRR
jgi:hypothetical protein